MSKCTAAQAIARAEYYDGYFEKATKAYVNRNDKAVFALDKGSNNYTWFGQVCGVQGGAWCAMMVSTAVLEACGGSVADARTVMHGVWPYTACNQLYDAAPSGYKGRRGQWTPKPGDVIVFSSDGSTREHTGMVYAVQGGYVYTIEGNSSNRCQKRSYLLTSSWIWGYVRPLYAAGVEPVLPVYQYGPVVCKDPELHLLTKGCAGPEVKTIQRIIYARGIDRDMVVDGDFGKRTKTGVINLQQLLGLDRDGEVGALTWTAALKKLA